MTGVSIEIILQKYFSVMVLIVFCETTISMVLLLSFNKLTYVVEINFEWQMRVIELCKKWSQYY